MRTWVGAVALAGALVASTSGQQVHGPAAIPPCAARSATDADWSITWHAGPIEDTEALDQWCRGVGAPIVEQMVVDPSTLPTLDDIVVVTWNAHLAEGRLTELITALRAGRFTDGHPVRHFVLLLQELFRRGPAVPRFAKDVRSAYAIKARDPQSPDAEAYAAGLGLSIIYVPSMRNGPELQEDRGNAIVSTEPLIDPIALELPFERQRRVAIGASVQVRTSKGVERLNLLDVHLEPLSAPSSLWIFRNPRRRQVAAVLDLLRTSRFAETQTAAGTVLGGDFNTIQGGVEEDAYQQARAWATSLVNEDRRPTHYMGRLDYLFFKLADQRQATTVRLNERFGSDHYPVLGRITADTDRH
jgi:endonuclease/exonuclease/phosphatase family metal-dependent hydrolase